MTNSRAGSLQGPYSSAKRPFRILLILKKIPSSAEKPLCPVYIPKLTFCAHRSFGAAPAASNTSTSTRDTRETTNLCYRVSESIYIRGIVFLIHNNSPSKYLGSKSLTCRQAFNLGIYRRQLGSSADRGILFILNELRYGRNAEGYGR